MKTQKTKKSMKKKALLSSVSMLMVATVAVGSATFAWFTQNPNASVEGLKMTADAANGLKILTQSHADYANNQGITDPEYLTKDYLNFDGTSQSSQSKTDSLMMTPASFTFTKANPDADESAEASVKNGTLSQAFTTTAAADNAKDANDNAAVTTITPGYDKKVYAEKVFCKLVGNSDANASVDVKLDNLNVTWTPVSSMSEAQKEKVLGLQDSVRFIITYTDKDNVTKVLGAYAKSAKTEETSLNGIIDASNDTPTTPEDKKDNKGYKKAAKSQVSYSQIPTAGAVNLPLGKVDTSGKAFVTLYVFIDGEDAGCKTTNISASDLINKVELKLSIPNN